MKVRMMIGISGGRGDGTPWPAPGEILDTDDREGRDLCAARLAVPVVEERAETPKPAEVDVEKRSGAGPAPRSGRR